MRMLAMKKKVFAAFYWSRCYVSSSLKSSFWFSLWCCRAVTELGACPGETDKDVK